MVLVRASWYLVSENTGKRDLKSLTVSLNDRVIMKFTSHEGIMPYVGVTMYLLAWMMSVSSVCWPTHFSQIEAEGRTISTYLSKLTGLDMCSSGV